jgi:hypothetical protein
MFLTSSDLKLVHYFFEQHQKAGKHAQHFVIQLSLSGAVGFIVLLYHFSERVLPPSDFSVAQFNWPRPLPYLTAFVVALALLLLAEHFRAKDAKFKGKSPGIEIESAI